MAKLTSPRIQAFRDDLLASLSRASAKKILTSLKMMLSDAQRRGDVTQNVALPVKILADKRSKQRSGSIFRRQMRSKTSFTPPLVGYDHS